MKKINFLLICLSFSLTQCQKNNEFISKDDFGYKAETVVDGLDIAWGMEFLPDGSILIAEQEGEMILFKDGFVHLRLYQLQRRFSHADTTAGIKSD